MIFATDIVLPCCRKTVHVKSITNEMHENLQKFLLENNDAFIENYFEYILRTCCIDVDARHFNVIDKFALLCKIRSISIGNTISLVNADNASMGVNMEQIIEQLQGVQFSERLVEVNNIKIKLGLPVKLVNETTDAALNCITSINDLVMSDLSQDERNKLFSIIDAQILQQLNNFFSDAYDAFKGVYFIPNIETSGFDPVSINPFNQSLFEILKIMFREDLFSFYRIKYFCMTKLSMTSSDFNNSIPADVRLFISFYNEDAARQNESLKNKNHALTNSINE